MKSKTKTPLFSALSSYIKKENISFHTPGHKSGGGISPKFKKAVGETVFKYDVSASLMKYLDSLESPRGVIREAERLAARAFSAEYTFFLVNGSTVGNQVMIMASCGPEDEIIIPRNVHKSVMSGIILSGARPVYIYPKINRDFGIFYNISLQQIKEVTANHPKAKVVLVTNPTYYGVVCSLREITKFLLRQGKILLVDEAHGAHFGLVKCFPPSAMSVGATASVQSTHKVLGSLSQGSMLHLKGKGLSSARIREVLSLFQTTSPSYLILASLDVARHQIETPEGRKKLERVFSLSQKLRKALSNLSEFRVLEKLEEFELDVTKLTITSPFISGHELAERLATEFKIHVELATHSNILLLLTIGTTSSDIHRTISAFQRIARQLKGKKRRPKISSFTSPPLTHQVMSPREALLRRKKIVSLKEARDSISGEMLYLYPPGIPILNPGELITPEIQAYLQTNGRKPAFQSRITILEE